MVKSRINHSDGDNMVISWEITEKTMGNHGDIVIWETMGGSTG